MNEEEINKNLNFIFNSFIDYEIKKPQLETFNIKATINDQIELIILFFENIIKYNNISFDDVFKNHLIIEKQENFLFKNSKNEISSGVYIYKNDILNEINIVELSIKLTHNVPLASTILICYKYTTSEEIIAFIYRVFKCEFKTPFFIANFHLISNDNKILVYDLFKQLENYNIKSLLIFLLPNFNKEEEIICGFKFFRQKIFKNKNDDNIFFDKTLLNIIQKFVDVNIICSNCSGIGKTEKIKEFAEKNKLNILSFPFGLEESRSKIIKCLNEKKNDFKNENLLLHINIYDLLTLDYINEFLFCVIFTKTFSIDEKLFILPENMKIFIEFSLGNFLEKTPILKYFENKIEKLDLKNLPKLIINKNNTDLKDKCNLICSYLEYLKSGEINTYNFCMNEDMNENKYDDEYNKDSRTLLRIVKEKEFKADEYITMISKVFDEQPTYYQLFAFVNILYLQLVNFSKNYMFKIEQLFDDRLINEGKHINKIEFKIRGLMIQKLIELSKFYSIPKYKNLFENQQLNIKQHNINQRNEDEAENIEIIEEKEKNKNILTFDKLPGGFIIFCTDNFTVRLITNSNNLKEEEKEAFENLYSSQIYNKNLNIPDYQNFTHEDYMKELRTYFGIEDKYMLDIPKG